MNAASPAEFRPFRAWASVAVLMTLQALSLIDRNILALMIIEVRADLGLNDFEVSLLQGLAFTVFFCTAGILIGSLVDRYPARRILYGAVTVWSLAAAATGLVQNFWGMMFARMMTGAGEGSANPSAQVMVAHLFPKNRISLPMSLYTASGAIGIGLSYFGGGVLLEMFSKNPVPGLEGFAPWRQVLIVVAAPGLLIAFLAFTLYERRTFDKKPASIAEGWREVGRFLSVERKLYWRFFFGYGLNTVMVYSVFTWAPTYARRVLEMTPSEIGTQMGLIASVGGILASALYGYVVDRQFSKGAIDFAMKAFVCGLAVTVPVSVIGFTHNSYPLFIAAVILVQCFLSGAMGTAAAAVQMSTPAEMRGRMGSLITVTVNLFGYSLGPILVASFTEFFFDDPQMVGVSIALTMLIVAPVSAWAIWTARPHFVARNKPAV